MIALDTNVLLRYFVQDDPKQSLIATSLIESRLSEACPGFVSLIVLCETVWTLRRTYKLTRSDVSGIVRWLLESGQVVVDERDIVIAALQEDVPDFADAIIHHLARARGCSHTVTFDTQFAAVSGVERLD